MSQYFFIGIVLSFLFVVSLSSQVPKVSGRINVGRGLLQGGAVLAGGVILGVIPNYFALAGGKYPIRGSDDLMKKKEHGSSAKAVQANLKYGCDVGLADRICNFNRRFAEHAGYWDSRETTFLADIDKTVETTYYDSVTGKALFIAPRGRTFEAFQKESSVHGWPSFRDEEVVWDNVRALGDGETVSLTGTHLGHNLPDGSGNRYCINLVCIAGNPV
mmetsp:Transcript_6004/g.6137  ORF Transcript_6004/g.6137 Transcript_6004/m.6137 type:complete len:217 (-) Transcript_6004:206-856(-)|eukprot:CAMPEP_0119041644 /NCGR_PEP_ID=MMETSP1177-20130426/12775_1 /TAXON_ID=2985 /ORGANISM="Ochromonas sp, Strain CCMP1899" /LENGTH=216 /DNA_ID=CAMNT_0007007847 /DNA_START=88 /DNA_END=738 /DNA_ORIENTATION=+